MYGDILPLASSLLNFQKKKPSLYYYNPVIKPSPYI